MTPEDRKSFYKTNNELFIDVGATNKSDAINIGIKPGNPIAPYSKVVELNNDRLLGKAWDDRIGCAMLLDLAKRVDDMILPYGMNFVFTTQEEIGLRGAMTTAYITNSDILLLDELFAVGDKDFEPECFKIFKGFNKNKKYLY